LSQNVLLFVSSGRRNLSDEQRAPSYATAFTLKFSRTKSWQNSAIALIIIRITTDIWAIWGQVDCQVKNNVFQRPKEASTPTNAAIGSRVPSLAQYRHVP